MRTLRLRNPHVGWAQPVLGSGRLNGDPLVVAFAWLLSLRDGASFTEPLYFALHFVAALFAYRSATHRARFRRRCGAVAFSSTSSWEHSLINLGAVALRR
jgi:hypothetical protein